MFALGYQVEDVYGNENKIVGILDQKWDILSYVRKRTVRFEHYCINEINFKIRILIHNTYSFWLVR